MLITNYFIKKPLAPKNSVFKPLNQYASEILSFKRLGPILALFYFFIMLFCGLIFHKVGGYGVETDFFWIYIPEAKGLAEGKLLIDAFRGPFYPIMLFLFQKMFLDYFTAGIVINTLSASFALWVIFELFTSIFDRTIAFLSTIFVMLNPTFVQFTYSNGTDMLFFLLSYVTLYFFFRGKGGTKTIIITALFASLTYLTRYNGVFLLCLAPIILIMNIWGGSFKKNLMFSISYIALFLIFISPWCIYTYINIGDFFYNHNYMNIAYEFLAKGKTSWDNFWYSNSSHSQSIYSVIFHNPIRFLSHFISNLFIYSLENLTNLMGWLIGIFSFIGLLFFIFNHKKDVRQTAYLIISFVFFAILCLVFYSDRFFLFLIPFYTVFSVKFLLEIKGVKQLNFSPKFTYSIIIIILYVSLCWTISYNMGKIDSGPKEILTISKWYKNKYPNTQADLIVAARKPNIAYYLNMNFEEIPFCNTYKKFYSRLKQEKVNYLYLSKRELANKTTLYYLIDTSKTFSGLIPLYYSTKYSCVLYKVN